MTPEQSTQRTPGETAQVCYRLSKKTRDANCLFLQSLVPFLFLLIFFLRKKKGNYKLTVVTLACSVPRPSLVSKVNLKKMLGRQGSRAATPGPGGVSSLFPWLRLGCRSGVNHSLTYAGKYACLDKRPDGFSLTWYRGNGSNPPMKSKLSSSSVSTLTT